jgi:hypothetical protein
MQLLERQGRKGSRCSFVRKTPLILRIVSLALCRCRNFNFVNFVGRMLHGDSRQVGNNTRTEEIENGVLSLLGVSVIRRG